MSDLQIGISKQCISPERPELLVPTGMGRRHPTLGVLDDLFTEAMAISVAGELAFLVTSEIRYYPHTWVQRIRDAVAAQTGCDPQRILFSSTHNHCSSPAPIDDSDEAQVACEAANEKIINAVIASCVEALRSKRPAEIACTSTALEETIGQNRRIRMDNGSCMNCWGAGAVHLFGRTFAGAAGPDSRRIDILCVREPGETEPFAIFTSYATHPHMYELPAFSGEFAGAAKRALEEQLPGICTMHANHAGGDQDIHCTHPMPDGHEQQLQWFKDSVQLLGQRFANAVLPALNDLHWQRPSTLRHAYVSSEDQPTDAKAPTYILNHLKLGDLAFVSMPGELFHNVALEMFERSPVQHLMLMGYNGSGGMYTPLAQGFEQGSYEVMRGPRHQIAWHGRRFDAESWRDTIVETLELLH